MGDSYEAYLAHLAAAKATAATATPEGQGESPPGSHMHKKRSRDSKPSEPKASRLTTASKASRLKPIRTAPPETSVQMGEESHTSLKTKQNAGRGSRPSSTVRAEDKLIDLSDDEYDSDALERIIKNKEEEEDARMQQLPLFDPAILHHFIDEWFANPHNHHG